MGIKSSCSLLWYFRYFNIDTFKENETRFMIDLCLVECPNLALESPKMYMPLANLYLAAIAKQFGYSVRLVDFRDRIDELPKAKFYGFSCTTPQIEIAKQLAKKVEGQTIVGGAHPSLLPEDCLGKFDYIIRGEGEQVLLDILSGKIKKGIITPPRITDLDTIPFPEWDIAEEPFSRTLYTGERYGSGNLSAPIIISRGCFFNCHFCSNIFRAPVVFRSVQNIIQEILELMKRNVYYLRFVDDNFTLYPQLEELCKQFKQLGIHYRCHTRSNLMTPIVANLLVDSGCDECSLGIESAEQSILKLNNKRENVIHHQQAIKILKETGIKVKTYWMSGLPGETDKTIDLNMQFMEENKPDKYTLSTFTPYPGCEIYKNPDKFGVEIINRNWTNWWNFVMPVKGKELPGRAGYVHILKGQTLEEMTNRYWNFQHFLEDYDKQHGY